MAAGRRGSLGVLIAKLSSAQNAVRPAAPVRRRSHSPCCRRPWTAVLDQTVDQVLDLGAVGSPRGLRSNLLELACRLSHDRHQRRTSPGAGMDCRLDVARSSRWRLSSASLAFFARISSRRCCILPCQHAHRRPSSFDILTGLLLVAGNGVLRSSAVWRDEYGC